MDRYAITTQNGVREWLADDADHAVEQHEDAFPDEIVLVVSRRINLDGDSQYHADYPLGA